MGKTATGRTRSWTCIVYPDSAPVGWRDTIDDQHLPWVESPLHDCDVDALGVAKKPHWHILIMFETLKSYPQVEELTRSICATVPQQCHSAKGLVRYMAHLDNPDKVQYDQSAIVGHGGVDVAELLRPLAGSRYAIIAEMRRWVEETGCMDFCQLFDFAAEYRMSDWFPLLCDNSAYIMGEYIRSRRNYQNKPVKVDRDTGEIVSRCVKIELHEDGTR